MFHEGVANLSILLQFRQWIQIWILSNENNSSNVFGKNVIQSKNILHMTAKCTPILDLKILLFNSRHNRLLRDIKFLVFQMFE